MTTQWSTSHLHSGHLLNQTTGDSYTAVTTCAAPARRSSVGLRQRSPVNRAPRGLQSPLEAEPGASAPGEKCTNVVRFDLVPAILHSHEGAGGGAGDGGEIMYLGINDQEGPGAVIFPGARGVDEPARAPAKGALRMESDRERCEIKADRARRHRQEELLSRGLS